MTNPSSSSRDLIGYGRTPPDPKWPGQARIAVQFVLNYEEGSEYSIPDGDGFSETALSEAQSGIAHGSRDLAVESVYEFGSRVGFWRIMELFAERGLPLTIFACALALERNPDAARAIVDAGHDVCCHGWRWFKHWLLDEDEERAQIRMAVASLERSLGKRAGRTLRQPDTASLKLDERFPALRLCQGHEPRRVDGVEREVEYREGRRPPVMLCRRACCTLRRTTTST